MSFASNSHMSPVKSCTKWLLLSLAFVWLVGCGNLAQRRMAKRDPFAGEKFSCGEPLPGKVGAAPPRSMPPANGMSAAQQANMAGYGANGMMPGSQNDAMMGYQANAMAAYQANAMSGYPSANPAMNSNMGAAKTSRRATPSFDEELSAPQQKADTRRMADPFMSESMSRLTNPDGSAARIDAQANPDFASSPARNIIRAGATDESADPVRTADASDGDDWQK